jgi:voltage-gated sodium channel
VLAHLCRQIAESPKFQGFILGAIGLATVLVGLATFDELASEYHDVFVWLDRVLLGIFTVEIAIRIIAYGARPLSFFRDPWNVFDFLTVAIFYLPFVGSEVVILRLARVLRALRLIRAVPGLRLLVVALVHSLPSIGYIGLLLLVQIYLFAIVGSFLFGSSDPARFANVAVAMQTLAQVVTFDDWGRIMNEQENQLVSTAYFVVFILIGTMLILNLFIGVVLEGFARAREQFAAERVALAAAVVEERNELEQELERIHQELTVLTLDVKRLMAATQRARADGGASTTTSARPGEAAVRGY